LFGLLHGIVWGDDGDFLVLFIVIGVDQHVAAELGNGQSSSGKASASKVAELAMERREIGWTRETRMCSVKVEQA